MMLSDANVQVILQENGDGLMNSYTQTAQDLMHDTLSDLALLS